MAKDITERRDELGSLTPEMIEAAIVPYSSPHKAKVSGPRNKSQDAEPQTEGDRKADNLFHALGEALPDTEFSGQLIQGPADNRLTSEFVEELAPILADKEFFQRNDRIVTIKRILRKDRRGKERLVESIVELTPFSFVTLIEKHCTPFCLRQRENASGKKFLIQIKKSITPKTAQLVLGSMDFVDGFREIQECVDLRLPVRSGETIKLSKPGYDPASQIFTSRDAPLIDENLPATEATEFLRSLLAEFCFRKQHVPDDKEPDPEWERSMSVAIAGMLTLFCTYLFEPLTLRPAFLVTANAEGAGKTLLISFAIVTRLGYVPTGCAPEDEAEMRKVLDSAIRDGSPILFLDNIKGHLNSGELEAAITSTKRRGRLLGSNRQFEAENQTTVFITGNNATFSPDLRRRVLAIELFLSEAKAEDRIIEHPLDENRLMALRPKILSALWSLVRSWHEAGEPKPEIEHNTFRSWSHVVGGILEHAGFSSPCLPSVIAAGGDTQTRDMEKLVKAMNPAHEYKFGELVELARDNRLFARLIPEEGDMDTAHKTRLGMLIRKYVGRIFDSRLRFDCIGDTRKTERFVVADLQPEHNFLNLSK
jgi:hypothetical protein